MALKNAMGWARRYALPDVDYRACPVTLEAWTDHKLRSAMEAMSEVEPRMTEDWVGGRNNATLPPRVDGLPAVVVKFGERYGMIDGKHRANRWKQVPGKYAVLVIQC